MNAYDNNRRTPLDFVYGENEIAALLARHGGFRAAGPNPSVHHASAARAPMPAARSVPVDRTVDEETVAYGYDESGRLRSVAHSGGSVTTYEYDALNNIKRRTRDGVPRTYGYDDRNQLRSIHTE